MQRRLKVAFSPALISQLTSSTTVMDELDLSEEERRMILTACLKGLRAVFASYVILLGVYFVCTLCVEEYRLDDNSFSNIVAQHRETEED